MIASEEINKRIRQLRVADAKARDLAAAELADLIEGDQLNDKDFRSTVQTLIQTALAETDPTAKESMFNALSEASIARGGSEVDWDPIASCLEGLALDCLEHALVILGFSQNPKYRRCIQRYLTHPDEETRSTASESLAMLGKQPRLPARKHG